MMKRFLPLAFMAGFSLQASAQIPAGYYDPATGYTGYALKSKLSSIITLGHVDHGYSGLYSGYVTTDVDHYYENDGSVLDVYSEKPAGTDAYTYNYTVSTDRCGNYNSEGDCFNREHIVPQSLFNSNSPMKNDIQFVIPTDGYVNGKRSNYPYGQVSSPTWTSSNGSKLGPNTSAGYSGTVFEPIDEFKGDIARATFYFVTRYQSSVPGFSQGNILDGTTTRGLQQWYVDLLMQWHHQDPVSQREIDRNNAAYTYQGNRNPYIDHPEYIDCIWGNANCAPDTSTSTGSIAKEVTYIDVYPNPTVNMVQVRFNAPVQDALQSIMIQSLDGRIMWSHEVVKTTQYQEQIDMSTYPAGVYILKIRTEKGLAIRKLIKE